MGNLFYKVELMREDRLDWDGFQVDTLEKAKECYRQRALEYPDCAVRLASYVKNCSIPFEIIYYKPSLKR
jgi:hypothetical protein